MSSASLILYNYGVKFLRTKIGVDI